MGLLVLLQEHAEHHAGGPFALVQRVSGPRSFPTTPRGTSEVNACLRAHARPGAWPWFSQLLETEVGSILPAPPAPETTHHVVEPADG